MQRFDNIMLKGCIGFVNFGSLSNKEIIMLKNKKFLIGFFTCASLVLIMAHDYNNNHRHSEYADDRHSHGGYGGYADKNHTHDRGYKSYAEENHSHDYGYNAYAPKDHSHGSGYNSYADRDHKHADLELLMRDAGYNLTHLDKLIKQMSGLDQEYNNIQTINKLKQRIEGLEYELLNHEH